MKGTSLKKSEVFVSISEINSYLRCRRSWDITSASRQSLRHKVTPKIYFTVGSGIHEAIEAQATGAKHPMEALEDYINKELQDRVEYYKSEVGQKPWKEELASFNEAADLSRKLAAQYFSNYGWENPLEDQGLEYVAVEVPFAIPFMTVGETDIVLAGTFDGIATDIETKSLFYLVENKTAQVKLEDDAVQYGNQFVGYNWAFRVLTGVSPSGTLLNGIKKREIKHPKVLKSGKLSQDKQASVTLATFLEALDLGGYNMEEYLDYIEFLTNREMNGDDRFFFREMYHYSNTQLDRWYESTSAIVSEMVDCPTIYPNFTSCQFCTVKDICHAMENDEDVESIVEGRYHRGTYGTMESMRSNGGLLDVGSSEELIDALRSLSTKE